MTLDRRRFLGLAAAGGAAALAGPLRPQIAAIAEAVRTGETYGPLGPPDDLGIRLPEGFAARLVGTSGEPVEGTTFPWHAAPDGGACFPVPYGYGHVYVSNSEVDDGAGGVSAVEFDVDGRTRAARTVLSGTSHNCSGGATPWGTWLSCEEVHPSGLVWEVDPRGGPAHVRPAMGAFRHEAAAVDEHRRQIFLTEDRADGRLYRFLPDRWPDLASGKLQAARVEADRVTWLDTPPEVPDRSPLTTAFDGGEGAVISDGSLLFATKGDRRIWELQLDDGRLQVLHDCVTDPSTPLTHVDNLAVHPVTGHLFIAEDGGDMDLCVLVETADGPVISRMVHFVGHDESEVAGPAFSPDGRFLYVSSQRGIEGAGMTVQIEGPFVEWIGSITQGATAGSTAWRIGNRRTIGP